MRPGVAHPHAPATAVANRDPLQQGASPARHAGPPGRVAGGVAGQSRLIGHELLPADVTRVGVTQAHRPLLNRDLDRSTSRAADTTPGAVLATLAIGVGAGVGGVVQDVQHPAAVGWHPDHVMRRRATDRAHRQRQAVPPQLAHNRLGALQLAELVEHELQPRPHLLVRVQRDPAMALLDQPGRQRQPQFAPRPSAARPGAGACGFGVVPPRS